MDLKDPKDPRDQWLLNLNVKCLILSAKDDEVVESHLLCSNDWMKSHGIKNDAKCSRICLILGGDACIWYETITNVDNDWNHLQDFLQKIL